MRVRVKKNELILSQATAAVAVGNLTTFQANARLAVTISLIPGQCVLLARMLLTLTLTPTLALAA